MNKKNKNKKTNYLTSKMWVDHHSQVQTDMAKKYIECNGQVYPSENFVSCNPYPPHVTQLKDIFEKLVRGGMM